MGRVRSSVLTVIATTVGIGTGTGAWATPSRASITFGQERPALALDPSGQWARDDSSSTGRSAEVAAEWMHRVSVANVGDQPATYVLQVKPTEPGTMWNRLLVTARDRRSGLVAYEGRLDELRISSRSALEPRGRVSYGLTVTWTAGSDAGNQLQGQSFRFRFTLSAMAAMGS